MKIVSAEFVKGIRGTDQILFEGVPQIAFVGRSNVGKSSLISGLMDHKAVVKISDRPGKTTEINFFKINGNIYFVDLPGYGYARLGPEQKEKISKMIRWYLTGGEAQPRVVVLVLDVKAGCTDFDIEMLALLREHNQPYILVANKVDKLNQKELAAQLAEIREASGEADVVLCSTLTTSGMDAVRGRLFAEGNE